MAEVATIRRWALREGADEATLLAFVKEKMIPAYKTVPGCLRQHLFRAGDPATYVALTFWESNAETASRRTEYTLVDGAWARSHLPG